MPEFNMIKILPAIWLIFLLWTPSSRGISFNRRRHPIPFYPGLKEPHGSDFYSGPHNQRRHNEVKYKEPHRVVFPNPNTSPSDLYAAPSFHEPTFERRPERVIFEDDNRVRDEIHRHREHKNKFRRPNHALRRPFPIHKSRFNRRRRPFPKRQRDPHFKEKRVPHSFDQRPPIVIYEGSRPPVLTYNRPTGSKFLHNRHRQQKDQTRSPNLSNERPNRFHRRPVKDLETFRRPSKDNEQDSEEGTQIYDKSQNVPQLPVFATTVTKNGYEISDNSGGWIPISSSSETYFNGVYGQQVQEYKEPKTDYGLDSQPALYENVKFDSHYDDLNEASSAQFGYQEGLGNSLSSKNSQTTHTFDYGDLTGYGAYDTTGISTDNENHFQDFRHNRIDTKNQESILEDGEFEHHNGYGDPTGHGEKLQETLGANRIAYYGGDNVDSIQYTFDPSHYIDIRNDNLPPVTHGQNNEVAVSYGYSEVEPTSYSNYEVAVRPGVYEINSYSGEPFASVSASSSASVDNQLRPVAQYEKPPSVPLSSNDGFSKRVPESRDPSALSDEAITVVGGSSSQQPAPSGVSSSTGPVKGPREWSHFVYRKSGELYKK